MLNKRKTAQKGIELIKGFEELRLKAYLCPAGVVTIGYGHTNQDGETFRLGQVITEEEAEQLLAKDLRRFENAVNSLVRVELSQNQFDAIVSFTFNLGGTTLRKSSVLRLLNENKMTEAANFLLRYKYADGKILRGLVRRRKAERDLFLS
jgi:lysozyme